ncbi:MAG: MATE family efflux transporter [Pontiella sp.]
MKNYFKHVREIFLFSIPVVAGKVSEILFGIGDVIVAGRYSTIVLGAMGVASAFIFPIIIFGVGVLSAISPLKARKIGAGEPTDCFPVSSLILATGAGVLLAGLSLLITRYLVPMIGYEPEFEQLVQTYLYISSFSIVPAMIFSALKELLLARSHTVVPNLLIFLFNFFNVAANIVLMFGLGMGIAGAAIATLLSRSLMALVLYFYTKKKTAWTWKVCSETVFQVLKVGIPTGGISVVVASVFAIVAMLVGKMSVVAAATNNVLINVTTFTFMIPLALSGVTAVKVGHAYGAGNLQKVREYTRASVLIGVTVAVIGGLLFWLLPGPIFRIFTNQPEVIAYGSVLLLYIAIYQIPDALQEIFVGALRGIGETTVPLVLSFVSIWMIGLSTGCYLAYIKKMDAAGLWLGLCIGLVFLGLFLGIFYVVKMRRLEAAE